MSLIGIDVGLRALERVVAANPVRIGVLPFDWATYVSHRTEEEIRPIVRPVTRAAVAAAAAARVAGDRRSGGSPAEAHDLGPRLRAATSVERLSLLRDVVETKIRWVLQFDVDRELPPDRNLFELGLDSIMAMELGNSLRRVVVGVSPNAPFSHSTVDALSSHLAELWDRSIDDSTEFSPATALEPVLSMAPGDGPNEVQSSLHHGSSAIREVADESRDEAGVEANVEPLEVQVIASDTTPDLQLASRPGIGRTGLLAGRSALVFGIADERSIGWGIARAFREHGAEVGVTVRNSSVEHRVSPLAKEIGATVVGACDVRDDRQIRQVMEAWGREHGALDILVDSVAFADPEDLRAGLANTGRGGFSMAIEVTAYSLVALIREARPLLRAGASVIALSSPGAQRAVQGYGVMGVAKATLEAVVRYLALELGPDGIRVNAISTGPIATRAAVTMPGFERIRSRFADATPMRTGITIEDVGETALYLASDLSRRVTGEILFVDGGFNAFVPPA